MEHRNYPHRYIRHILSLPFIYGIGIPIVLFDICVEIYHRVTFFLYDMPYVKRSEYIRIDRHRLGYLHWLEKIHCMYCGYVNGLFHYVTEIAARTEKYWCGIKHKNDPGKVFYAPAHHDVFAEYGNQEALKKFLEKEKNEKL